MDLVSLHNGNARKERDERARRKRALEWYEQKRNSGGLHLHRDHEKLTERDEALHTALMKASEATTTAHQMRQEAFIAAVDQFQMKRVKCIGNPVIQKLSRSIVASINENALPQGCTILTHRAYLEGAIGQEMILFSYSLHDGCHYKPMENRVKMHIFGTITRTAGEDTPDTFEMYIKRSDSEERMSLDSLDGSENLIIFLVNGKSVLRKRLNGHVVRTKAVVMNDPFYLNEMDSRWLRSLSLHTLSDYICDLIRHLNVHMPVISGGGSSDVLYQWEHINAWIASYIGRTNDFWIH